MVAISEKQLNRRSQISIAVITAVALGLRLWGIEWGLPNALHYRSYQTDETVMLMHSTTLYPGGLNIFAGSFLPHFYNYGSLQLELINIAVSIVAGYHHSGSRLAEFHADYLTGRLLTVFMGTATVWALWALGRRIYSENAGLLAALLLAVMPLHAQQSHFATVDVPATLWVVLALLWSAKASGDTLPLRSLAIAGVFAGLATATKYNCALVVLPVFFAAATLHAAQNKNVVLTKATGVMFTVIAMLAAYFVACPGTLLENNLFLADVRFEAVHVSTQQELWFQGTGIGWWYILARNLSDGLGLPLLVASLAGLVHALIRRKPGDLLTLCFGLPYYLLIGSAVSRYARYEEPLLPILALWAGRFLADWSEPAKMPTCAKPALAIAVALFTAISAVFLLIPMSQIDPRDRAAGWISQNVPKTSMIGMPVQPWFWSPPLSPYFSTPGADGQWLRMPMGDTVSARLVVNPEVPFDTSLLQMEKPPVVVMSEYEYFDRLRLHDPAALSYLAELRRNYGKAIVFSDVHWLGGRKSIDGLPCQDLPHDMLYTSPTVLIFLRR